jgi:hypothetical protein
MELVLTQLLLILHQCLITLLQIILLLQVAVVAVVGEQNLITVKQAVVVLVA